MRAEEACLPPASTPDGLHGEDLLGPEHGPRRMDVGVIGFQGVDAGVDDLLRGVCGSLPILLGLAAISFTTWAVVPVMSILSRLAAMPIIVKRRAPSEPATRSVGEKVSPLP